MKIIHTSDWHLGQNFYNYDRDEEHQFFFAQLYELVGQEHPDALVVSGDIFNTWAPNVQAQKLFVEAVIGLHDHSPETVIVITSGNHDSGSRLEAMRKLWHRVGVHVVGGYRRDSDDELDPKQFIVNVGGKGWVVAVPFFHPSNFPVVVPDSDTENRQQLFFESLIGSIADDGKPVVMMAHLAVDGSNFRGHEEGLVGGQFTTQLSKLGEGYDYLALGHIHMPQKISERAYYSGSPIPLSFTEDYDHYVNVVEIARRGEKPMWKGLKFRP
ncbi:MAG: exonuclease subunit SbcD [Bacteroidales bacterium]|nr:exonuclease subunit SbcD [Bacteroidales bacterium]